MENFRERAKILRQEVRELVQKDFKGVKFDEHKFKEFRSSVDLKAYKKEFLNSQSKDKILSYAVGDYDISEAFESFLMYCFLLFEVAKVK